MAQNITTTATTDRNLYGAYESNGLVNGTDYHQNVDYTDRMTLSEVSKAGGKITRVRILTERVNGQMFCDISYIHATLPNGRTVDVQNIRVDNMTPYHQLMGRFIDWAKAEKVFAKGVDLLNKGNWSVLS